ncbi:NAD-dependent histone deacetylase Hst3p [[Candida] anglica]|uniref:NAD-dependent histone deacetylase Hst3p n=1 Tax=[Candida] anglica TaxID=148631 RepID=A0ABP0EHD7_9ASCO
MKTIDLTRSHEVTSESSIRMAEISKIIYKAKKTTVLTGAGISCNAGIPDFRSSDGLYNMVKAKHPKSVVRGQDLFDISLFRDETSLSVFCTFMEALYTSTLAAKPTETHKFIKTLKEKKKLLRCYTQNIDGLEKNLNLNIGLSEELLTNEMNSSNFTRSWKDLDVVQLHGDLHKLSCTHCFTNYNWTREYQVQLSDGTNPECSNCHEKYMERLYSGKRMTGNIGLLRPSIVLYGENHPQAEFLARGLSTDLRSRPDLLIIMGTSLKVDGVKKLVRSLASSIHDKGGKIVFVNKTPVSTSWSGIIDYQVLGDCDEFVRAVKREIPDLFLTQEQLDSKKLKYKSSPIKSMGGNALTTPPCTPTKLKREVSEALFKLKTEPGMESARKRLNLSIPTPELTPASSFDEKHTNGLRMRTDSELNQIKLEKEVNTPVKREHNEDKEIIRRGASKRVKI